MKDSQSAFLRMAVPTLVIGLGVLSLVSNALQFHPFRIDMAQDYASAVAVRLGEDPYGAAVLRISEALGRPFAVNDHPPAYIGMFLPLSFLPFSFAHAALAILSVLSLWDVLRTLWRSVSGNDRRRLLFFGILLCWYPVQNTVAFGQLSLILLWLCVRAVFLGPRLQGIALGLAAAIKVYPLIAVVPLVVQKKWSTLLCVVLTGVFASLILDFRYLGSLLHYCSVIAPANSYQFGSSPLNASLFSLPLKLFGGAKPWDAAPPIIDLPKLGMALALGVFILGILIATRITLAISRVKAKDTLSVVFPLIFAFFPILSPVTWAHGYVFILPLLVQSLHAKTSRAERYVAVICFATLLIPDYILVSRSVEISSVVGAMVTAAPALWTAIWIGLASRRQIKVQG